MEDWGWNMLRLIILDKAREPTEHTYINSLSQIPVKFTGASHGIYLDRRFLTTSVNLIVQGFNTPNGESRFGLGSMAYGFEHPIETYFGSLVLPPVPSPIFIVELAEVAVWCEQEVAQSPWGPSGPARGCLLVVGHWTSANWRGGDQHDAPCLSWSIHGCRWMCCAIYRFSFLSSFQTAVSTGTHFFWLSITIDLFSC